MNDKTRETRLRGMARRQGLELSKSRRRDPNALDYGLYALIMDNGGAVNPAIIGHFVHSWDLDQVEYYLKDPEEYQNKAARNHMKEARRRRDAV